MSNQSINLKDYEIVYNNGTSDAVWPLEDDIVLAPGESAVIWCVLQTVLDTGLTDANFINYWKEKIGSADLNLVRGKNFTRAVCNGLANSGERSMVIRAKATREVLTMVAYNGKGNIEANQSITFTYTDGTEGAISNYTAAPTPGSTEDGQVTGTYQFVEGPAPAPTAADTQSANEAWRVEAPLPESGLLLNAVLHVKGSGENDYTAYPMTCADGKAACELSYSRTKDFGSFDWYVTFDYGISQKSSTERTVTVEQSGEADTSNLPALLITELLPNSSNKNGADAYEFVEVYNNSNQRINLKDYRLYYNNNLDAGDNDVLWASFDKDLYLESGACMVFWIHNGSNDTLTVDDFNEKFGTNLVENQNIIILENGGMSNSAPRGLRITTNVHDEVNYVTYNVGENDANGNDHADKTITYRYDGTKSVKMSNVAAPTAGSIPAGAMNLALSLGVAVSLGLAMIRVLTGISIMWFLVPGYVLSLALSFVVPQIFTSVAFDSGGVASGPMTATFLLPFALGACDAVGGNLVTDAFGVVAMVAMTPLVTIQLLGLSYQRKLRRAPAPAAPVAVEELIELC